MGFKRLRYNQYKNTDIYLEPFLAVISKLYLLCQLFATAPVLDTPKRNRRLLRYMHYVWCSTLVTYITAVNICYTGRIHSPLVNIVKAFFAFELINNPLIVALIVFTAYHYTAEYRSIPSELLRIYKVYRRLQANVGVEKEFFRVLHKEVLVMIGVICSIVLSTFLLDYFRSVRILMRITLNASVFSVANILISLHICQFWLSLRFVCHLYRGFNEVLRQRLRRFRIINLAALDEYNNDLYAYVKEIPWYQREFQNARNAAPTDSFDILDTMHDIYFDLDTIRTQLTNVFSLTLLFNFLGSCVSLSVQFFAVFKFFDTKNFLNDVQAELYNRILWIIIHLGRIMTILISNNAIIEEKCRTSVLLNELLVTSKEMERSINRFLLQLMIHQPPEMLCGILQLDLLLLCGIIGAVSNYFIFLIQIDLGTLPNQHITTNTTLLTNTAHHSCVICLWAIARHTMLRCGLTLRALFELFKLPFVKLWQALGKCYSIMCMTFACFAQKMHDFGTDLGQETGILAISLMANRRLHVLERFLWFLLVLACIFCANSLSGVQLKRYLTSPTVISVDRDYRGWHGALPAVTLCYYDHIDSFKANEFIQNNWNVSIVDNDYFYFMDFLYAVVNATASNYADLARFAEDERFDDVNLSEVVRAIDRPFEQALTSFDKQNASIQIRPVMTERGYCYAINSPMSEILAGRNIEYKDVIQPLTCEYGIQQCFIKMDLYESTGTVDVHSPFEVSASDANIISLHKSDEIIASFKVLETVASKNLRDLQVDQRKCVFYDEETSQLKVYSKTLCLVRCRAVMALEMCNCVPFFYAFVEGPSCNPAGFECLLDFKWPIWALHICKCPSTCTEIEYTVQTVKKSYWGAKTNDEIASTDLVTSSFRWDVIPPKVRMRRDVVFSFEDLLVSFGGTLALFLGFSQISVVRIGYVTAYHLIMTFVELICSLKKFCGCRWRISKRKPATKRILLVQTVSEEKPKIRFGLHKKRQQLITTHARVFKNIRPVGTNDNSRVSE